MDPNSALIALLDAIVDKDRDATLEYLSALQEWIEKGGFLPEISSYCAPPSGESVYTMSKKQKGE